LFRLVFIVNSLWHSISILLFVEFLLSDRGQEENSIIR
jgi:hypothetical protein